MSENDRYINEIYQTARDLHENFVSTTYEQAVVEMTANLLGISFEAAQYNIHRTEDVVEAPTDVSVEALIEITRKLLDGSRTDAPTEVSASAYRRALRDVLIEALEVDHKEASDILRNVQPPSNEHVVLVAFQVTGDNMEAAQVALMEHLPRPENKDNNIESWWIAMDERYEGSDNDSAEFVEGSGTAALDRFRKHRGLMPHNRTEWTGETRGRLNNVLDI